MSSLLANKLHNAKKLSKLGANLSDKFILFFLVFWPFINKRLKKVGIKTKKTFNPTISFNGITQRVELEGLHDEITLLYEIFIEECYSTPDIKNPRIIVDVGANIGISPLYFYMKFQNATIFAIEPEPNNFKRLERNIRGIPNIIPRQLAFSDKNGDVDFYIYPDKIISSSLEKRLQGQMSIKVKSTTADNFILEEEIEKIDLFKFDVEGAEFKIFSNFKNLDKVQALIGETHEDLMGESFEEFYNLISNNYKFVRKEAQKSHREFIYAIKKDND